MQRIIKEIKPDPILTSTVEIRFSANIKSEEVLGFFYKIYGNEFPKITEKKLPEQLKAITPQLEYFADYSLANESYIISVGKNVITFENVGEYKLWENYFILIKESLKKLSNNDAIKVIKRVGLRYVSIFENSDKLNEVINVDFLIGYEGFRQTGETFRTLLIKDPVQLNLQIIQNVNAKKGNEEKNGVYIDIDASQEKNLSQNFDDELFTIIDKLHTEEKKLFSFIMKESYLQALNTIYK